MAFSFNALKQAITDAEEWLKREFAGIHTGRATPAVLDTIYIDSYGSLSPVKHIAGITIEDPRTLRIAPWDKGHVQAIEKAIVSASMSFGVAVDEKGIRVTFPELTAERRSALTKVLGQKLEEARVTIRKARDEAWQDIQGKERADEITEDEKFRFKEDMEKMVKEVNESLEAMVERKEKEIAGN